MNEKFMYNNNYNSINKMINIEEVKCITYHTHFVSSLLQLKDKRIASCSYDKSVRIYDPSNAYHCDQELKRHSKHIFQFVNWKMVLLSPVQMTSQ